MNPPPPPSPAPAVAPVPDDLAPLRVWYTLHHTELRELSELTLHWPTLHLDLVGPLVFSQAEWKKAAAHRLAQALLDVAAAVWKHPQDEEEALGFLSVELMATAKLPPFGLTLNPRREDPRFHPRASELATLLVETARTAFADQRHP